MELELEWDGDDGLLADRYVITYEDHSRRVWVESYEQRLNGRVEIGLVSRRPLGSGVYGLADGGEIAVEFSGLSPDEPAGRVQLMELAARLKTLRRSIQWLGPARVEPPALIPSSSLQRIDPDGTGAAEILVQDSDILADVQAWYAREPVGRRLRKEQISGDYHRLVLDTEAGPYGVGLNQTGDGMAHVLPVLAASAVARRLGTRGILAVEDPGAHLHDDARRALATHLCEIAATSAPPKFVLETHSRTFLLSVQLAIAKGSLPPDSVAVHWVVQGGDGRSSAQLVEFESNGLPRSSVLSDILSEDRALARELLNMQLPDMP